LKVPLTSFLKEMET